MSCEVVVNHNKEILSVTTGHPGTRNDKTIVRLDQFIMGIHNRDICADVELLDGRWKTLTGVWLMASM